MDNIEAELHRTLVQLLIDSDNRDLAAVMIDGGLEHQRDFNGYPVGIAIDIPTHAYMLVSTSPELKQSLVKATRAILGGRVEGGDLDIQFRVMRVVVEEGWQAIAREMIVNQKANNQAAVTRLVFHRKGKALLSYNELGYGSHSELRIAQELEQRQILFFPLAVGVRADTGELYRDHREPDFLVCDDGRWGILEVAYHPDRYEKDKEKDSWWKKSGILCVEHFTAERCYNESAKVVDEFLAILRQHRR